MKDIYIYIYIYICVCVRVCVCVCVCVEKISKNKIIESEEFNTKESRLINVLLSISHLQYEENV